MILNHKIKYLSDHAKCIHLVLNINISYSYFYLANNSLIALAFERSNSIYFDISIFDNDL